MLMPGYVMFPDYETCVHDNGRCSLSGGEPHCHKAVAGGREAFMRQMVGALGFALCLNMTANSMATPATRTLPKGRIC